MPRVRTLIPDGDEIRARRLRLGLTAKDLADRLHRHPQTIRQLESGAIEKASEILLHQLALALGAQAEDITKTAQRAA